MAMFRGVLLTQRAGALATIVALTACQSAGLTPAQGTPFQSADVKPWRRPRIGSQRQLDSSRPPARFSNIF